MMRTLIALVVVPMIWVGLYGCQPDEPTKPSHIETARLEPVPKASPPGDESPEPTRPTPVPRQGAGEWAAGSTADGSPGGESRRRELEEQVEEAEERREEASRRLTEQTQLQEEARAEAERLRREEAERAQRQEMQEPEPRVQVEPEVEKCTPFRHADGEYYGCVEDQ